MKVKNIKNRLVKLPSDTEFAIFMIKQELKSNMLLDKLTDIGFDDSYYRLDLGTAILESIGFDKVTDELFEVYLDLLRVYCGKIKDPGQVMKYAVRMYIDLEIERRKRQADN